MELRVYKDIHSKSDARIALESDIENNKLDVLFFEYNDDEVVDYNRKKMKINLFFQNLIHKGKNFKDDVQMLGVRFFRELNEKDAEPSLRTIARCAINNGVQVNAFDKSKEKTMEEIRMKFPKAQESYLITETGLKIRDSYAGNMIGSFIAEGPFSKPAILWGKNHFDRMKNKEPLSETIIKTFKSHRYTLRNKKNLEVKVIVS